jgi:predicted metal-dependent hydrolase
LLLATGPLSYELVRAQRRSIAIQAVREGIRVRAPRWASIGEIETFMRLQQDWIRERLAARRDVRPFSWTVDAELPLLGEILRIRPASGSAIAARDGCLEVPAAQLAQGGRAVIAWIKRRARALFEARIEAGAEHLGVAAPRVRLSGARTRWGSCSHGPGGPRVSLHWKLYLLPPALVDYVVAHELAHLKELNHSARFWAVVGGLYPDYKAARLELNRLGRALPLL